MRTTTAGELTALAATTRQITPRIKVANGSGTMGDLSSWFEHISISHDVDQPVGGCTLSFSRALSDTQSLSPLRTDSTLNRLDDLVTYSPRLDLNRSVTVEIATTPVGTAPVAGDYKLLFKGTIDVVHFEHDPIVCVCRDLGAPLVDRWVETEALYGTGVPGSGVGGQAIQTVMQNIIDAVFGGGVYTLYVPVSPGYNINTFKQQRMSVMDALQDLIQLIGWDVRFKWDDGTSAFRLTLSEPPRTKTTPDHTFTPDKYYDISDLSLELTNIRNVLIGSYKNYTTGARATVTVSDAPSIAKYGRRPFFIQEGDLSPIDTSGEMTTMLNAGLADLKDPKANQAVETPLFWPADISDLYRYPDNKVHYNTDQDIAVVEFAHQLSKNSHRTSFKVRGTPIGQYATWLGRGGIIGATTALPPRAIITTPDTESDNLSIALTFDAIQGSGGGGTNLTYIVYQKLGIATSTLYTGDASTLPRAVTILKSPTGSKVLRYVVSDAVTGMSDELIWAVPASLPFIDPTGVTLDPTVKEPGGVLINRVFLKTASTDPNNADAIATGSVNKSVPLTVISANNDVAARKVKGSSSTPSLSNIHAFWNGSNSIVGSDTAGMVTLNKTATPATETNATQFKVNFAVAYAAAPYVLLTNTYPFGSGAGGDFIVSAVTTTDFTVAMVNATILATGAATYTAIFNYAVIG